MLKLFNYTVKWQMIIPTVFYAMLCLLSH